MVKKSCTTSGKGAIAAFLAIAVALGMPFMRCTGFPTFAGSGSEAGNAEKIAILPDHAFIDLPSSIAKAPAGLARRRGKTAELELREAVEVYDYIREYIGFADMLVNDDSIGVKALIRVFGDSINWRYVTRTGTVSGEGDRIRFIASYSADRAFAYRLDIQSLDASGNPLALRVDCNGDFDMPAGRVYYDLGLLEPERAVGARMLLEIAVTDTARILRLSLAADTVLDDGNPDDLQNLRLDLLEEEGIIHVSGSSYHPLMDSLLPDTVGYCYTFIGAVDSGANRSIVRLGLPPASYDRNDSALYTTYGIATMFSRALINYELSKLGDTLKAVIVTSYTDSMNVRQVLDSVEHSGHSWLRPHDLLSDMTLDDLRYFLGLNRSVVDAGTRRDFAALLWLLELEQPVYFEKTGYAGNGATVPPGFETLAGVAPRLESQIPDLVRTLTVEP